MRHLIFYILLIMIGCKSNSQNKQSIEIPGTDITVIIKEGVLIEYDGIDVSKHNWGMEDVEIEALTLENLLCEATDECDETLIIQLLNKGANVNARCEEVDHVITNLAWCESAAVRLAKMFLEKNADINGADSENDSFLSYAIGTNNLELTEYLIDNGANKTQRDTNGNMGCLPIHSVESLEMLLLLESKGFKIDENCNNGRTLLHFAARENFEKIVKYLLEKNLVNKYLQDKNGETSLDYAIKAGNDNIVRLLQE